MCSVHRDIVAGTTRDLRQKTTQTGAFLQHFCTNPVSFGEEYHFNVTTHGVVQNSYKIFSLRHMEQRVLRPSFWPTMRTDFSTSTYTIGQQSGRQLCTDCNE